MRTDPRLAQAARTVRDAYRSVGYARARWNPPIGTRPSIGLAVCAIFRDEARYLAEWVTFHRLQGAERFYLYDNGSQDDWYAALMPEIESGIVEVRDWPEVPGQATAYEDCLRRHRTDTRWVAFIDADEFLFSPTGRSLPDVLGGFDRHPAVAVNWRVFGTNGWERSPQGLVIENYVLRGPDDHHSNFLVKSIVYPRQAVAITDQPAHYFRLRGNPVGEDMEPVLSHTRRPPTADLLRINHYYAKSAEAFERKAARPRADYGTVTERFMPPPDVVRDETILQFSGPLNEAMAGRGSARDDQIRSGV